MTVEEEAKAKKTVLVGIRIDSQSRELINWAFVKVAEPGDCVIAAYVCRNSDKALKDKPLLDAYLEVYEGLCSEKKVNLTSKILIGSSIKKTMVKEAKNCAADTIIVGIIKPNALLTWATVARYCAKHLPATTEVIAVNNGKVVFRNCSRKNSLSAPKEDSRTSFKKSRSEYGGSDVETECSTLDNSSSLVNNGCRKVNTRSMSLLAGEPLGQKPGWPLLRTTSTLTPKTYHARKVSVVHWVMSLPDRSPPLTPQSSSESEHSLGIESGDFESISNQNSPSSKSELELLLKTSSSCFRWFSLEILKTATSQFSSENLIGEGGCNHVYKGILPDGKKVAVKISNSSEEAWKGFATEVEIITSLKNKHIPPLIGVCVEENNLISVYDYFSKGPLEENLQGTKTDKNVLSWEVRFNIAVGVAEALYYLHDECSRPVIHRDVKSSNILLSDGLEPQLSDFGLAIWGPTTSSFLTQVDIVGTFGYLAPEYFMSGKVSDKIDVYSFGVVLLELLSGRKPICSETPKGQESLVMWAKPKIESGDFKGLLDPKLDEDINEVQVQRMVVAATLCLTRSARLRPKMSEILKLLRGEKDVEKWVDFQIDGQGDSPKQDDNDDEVYPDSCAESHLSLALLDVNEDSTSFSSVEQSNSVSVEEYLKKRCSRSTSLD